MIIPFPQTPLEALQIIANAQFDEDDIAEYGDNLVIIKDGDRYTITEPDAEPEKEVTYRFTAVE